MKFAPLGAWNWWNLLIAALAAAIVVALVLGPREELAASLPPPDSSSEGDAAAKAEPDQADLRNALDLALAAQRGRRAIRTETEDPAIGEHLEKLDNEIDPDEAAARLSALGNLYQQKKGDFRTAAGYYEILIARYPEWPGIVGAYRELVNCYEALDEQQELRLLYRKMLEAFPEDSDEHRMAQSALAG